MQRRDFLRVSAGALGAGYLLDPADAVADFQPPGVSPPQPAPATDHKSPADAVFDSPPVLQNPASDGMTVVIAVKTISTAWVEFGPTAALGQRADDSRHGLLPLSGRVHRVRLENLKPNTEYHYRVGAAPIDFKSAYKIMRKEAVFTPPRTFRTLGLGSTASFAVINDTHENVTTLTGVAARLAAQRSQLTFWNGDVFNDVRSDDQIVANIMRPAGAAYAAGAPLCFVSGNHDVRGIHARSLDRFVDVPRDRRYYTLRHGPIAFLVLDTGEDKPDDHQVYAGLNDFARYRDEQRAWLERAVQQEDVRSARFRVVVQHIPMWGGGSSDDSRRKWADTLAKARIHAMICGHTHKYAWTPADGEHAYPQLVGGGPAPESATVIEGRAEGAKLSLVMRDLSGKEVGNYEVKS